MFGVEAQRGIRVEELGNGKPAVHKAREALPVHPVLLAAAPQSAHPAFAHFKSKVFETLQISGYGVIVEEALHYAPQPFPQISDRLVPASAKLHLQLFELSKESLPDGLA
jgi:hypothetical protein